VAAFFNWQAVHQKSKSEKPEKFAIDFDKKE